MPNHYHLQVETPEANLSQAIHWLNVGYSVWLNRKYGRVSSTIEQPIVFGRLAVLLVSSQLTTGLHNVMAPTGTANI